MSTAPPRDGGTYVLVFKAESQASVAVGALEQLRLQPGYYLYVGSAHGGGGLQARVGRHLRTDKPHRWHMDYLRAHLHPVAVWWQADTTRLEDEWVQQMPRIRVQPIFKGFGASDSRHLSHLFFSASTPSFADWRTIAPSCQCWSDPLASL